MASHGYDTPSDEDSIDTSSPIELENQAAGSTKRRLAPSGNSQREAKTRRTGEAVTAPGGQGATSPRSGNGDQSGRLGGQSYGASLGMVISGQGAMLMEDPYQRHGPKREELVDQKLMDELKADLGDPLLERQPATAASARSPPAGN